jgi:hypothetical protein
MTRAERTCRAFFQFALIFAALPALFGTSMTLDAAKETSRLHTNLTCNHEAHMRGEARATSKRGKYSRGSRADHPYVGCDPVWRMSRYDLTQPPVWSQMFAKRFKKEALPWFVSALGVFASLYGIGWAVSGLMKGD